MISMENRVQSEKTESLQAVFSAKVLNVDSDWAARLASTRFLTSAGYDVEEANNGREAVRKANALPDIIVLNAQLPDIDGFSVCECVKGNSATAKIPVILVSSTFVLTADNVRVQARGPDGYLTQPIEAPELIGLVNALLRLKRAEESAGENARYWHATLDAMSDALCQVGTDGAIVRGNGAMAEMAGVAEADLRGLPFKLALDPMLIWAGDLASSDITSKDHFQEVEVRGRWYRVSCDVVLNSDSEVVGYVYVFKEITDVKLAEVENTQLLEQIQASVAKERVFVREILSNITEGRLKLCETDGELPPLLPRAARSVNLTERNITVLRKSLKELAEKLHYSVDRSDDLITAVSEGAMNAILHGGGGIVNVYSDGTRIQVSIVDFGTGIAIERIPDATLRRGYTTSGTLGHGFWLMLKTIDRVYLLTNAKGTTIILEQDLTPDDPPWLSAYRPVGWGLSS